MKISGEIKLKWSDGYWYEPEYEGMSGYMEWYGMFGNVVVVELHQYDPHGHFFAKSKTGSPDHMCIIPDGVILQEAQAFAEEDLAKWFRNMGLVVE